MSEINCTVTSLHHAFLYVLCVFFILVAVSLIVSTRGIRAGGGWRLQPLSRAKEFFGQSEHVFGQHTTAKNENVYLLQ